MARAAAKRRPTPRPSDAARRKHKDSGGQRFEDTLFFSRLRKQAKWVFVLLIVAFGLGFVLFGVGNSNLGNLGDIFNGISGGGGNPSVDKPLKKTQRNPKDAQAWKDLATAYEIDGNTTSAISSWQQYTSLRPKDPEGFTHLATDLTTQYQNQQVALQNAQQAAQSATPATFGPPSTTPLGRALGSQQDPIAQAQATQANTLANTAYSNLQQTASQLQVAYQSLSKLQPSDSATALQYAQAADAAGDATTAVAQYKRFLKLAPDDPTAPQVKSRLKALVAQQKATSSASSSG